MCSKMHCVGEIQKLSDMLHSKHQQTDREAVHSPLSLIVQVKKEQCISWFAASRCALRLLFIITCVLKVLTVIAC